MKRPLAGPSAIDAYLVYQAVPAPLTAFQGVKQLPPAHHLTFDVGSQKLNLQRYWDVTYSSKLKLSEGEVLEEMDAILRRARGDKRRLRSVLRSVRRPPRRPRSWF